MTPQHIKFGDEPTGPSLIEATPEAQKLSEEARSSHVEQTEDEDEAPEAESLSVARSKAKARMRDAARAIERYVIRGLLAVIYLTRDYHSQEAEARERRRMRDKRLKEQASLQKAKKQRQTKVDSSKSNALGDINDEEKLHPTTSSILGTKPLGLLKASELPNMLPDEILAAKPYVRPTQSVKAGSQKQTSNKHILFRAEVKRPKDIQRGGVRVRVLETNNPKLPPKSSKNAKAVRESWLVGRSGKGGVIERRKMGSSFLRR